MFSESYIPSYIFAMIFVCVWGGGIVFMHSLFIAAFWDFIFLVILSTQVHIYKIVFIFRIHNSLIAGFWNFIIFVIFVLWAMCMQACFVVMFLCINYWLQLFWIAYFEWWCLVLHAYRTCFRLILNIFISSV